MKKRISRVGCILILMTIVLSVCGIASYAQEEAEVNFTYMLTAEGEAVITGGMVEGHLTIPGKINGYRVAGIEEEASLGKKIASLTLEEGIRYIEKGAFSGCVSLDEVHLPETLQYIGEQAFFQAERLKTITIPEATLYVGSQAFGECRELKEIHFPQTAIVDEYAFEESGWQQWRDRGIFVIRGSTLIEVKNSMGEILEIPYGITAIEEWALGFYKGIYSEERVIQYEEVRMPSTLVYLGTGGEGGKSGVFRGAQIKKINIPDGVEVIPSDAFASSALEEISISSFSKLKIIDAKAFFCSELRGIHLPDGLEVIRENAFAHCNNLKTITIPSTVNAIRGHAFYDCINLEEVIFEEGLETIVGNSFQDCHSIQRLQYPESLKWISTPIYDMEGLERIYIPEKTKVVDDLFTHSKVAEYSVVEFDGIVYGQSGSVAQEEAKEAGLSFVEISKGEEMP